MEKQSGTFDFDTITIGRSIIRGGNSAMPAPLSRTTNAKGDTYFRFSDRSFTDMALEVNSLSVVATPDGARVFLLVYPGNTGSWFKQIGTKNKGNKAKHNELARALDKAGITGKGVNITEFGAKDGATWFELSPYEARSAYVEPTGPGTESTKKSRKAAAPAAAAE